MKTLKNIFNFYIDGFKNMKLGKTLWLVVFVKFFIMIFILKMFIFDKNIHTEFQTDEEKINFIYQNLKKD
ncbi:DUF4492 domain-containing protein [Campylobacter ureolyticus]|uniref:DUF4492 domain-containing protein n=1 Tax=Campylobacter ureolyticus TaxID=827 RepID=UPI00291244E2|nr:DUF4492 domain-containing protein [Campylobacter ureolyticus]MDU7070517.1 DUF4492 domain-containing protein [Campylobacter ureolyticus]